MSLWALTLEELVSLPSPTCVRACCLGAWCDRHLPVCPMAGLQERQTPRRSAVSSGPHDTLQFRKTLLWVREPDPLAFHLDAVCCCEEVGIPESRGQCWMPDKPCVSSLLLGITVFGPGRGEECCQQAVICKEEIGFADIIKPPLRSHAGQSSQTVYFPPLPQPSLGCCLLSSHHISPQSVLPLDLPSHLETSLQGQSMAMPLSCSEPSEALHCSEDADAPPSPSQLDLPASPSPSHGSMLPTEGLPPISAPPTGCALCPECSGDGMSGSELRGAQVPIVFPVTTPLTTLMYGTFHHCAETS